MAEEDAIVWDFNFFNYCSLEAKWLTGATSNCLVIYLKSPETSQPREHYITNPPCENLKACRANSKGCCGSEAKWLTRATGWDLSLFGCHVS